MRVKSNRNILCTVVNVNWSRRITAEDSSANLIDVFHLNCKFLFAEEEIFADYFLVVRFNQKWKEAVSFEEVSVDNVYDRSIDNCG